jgi:hypothetical protein
VAVVFISSGITGCFTTRGCPKINVGKKNSIEDFDKFYNRFHKDTLFQVSRIKFPLGGMFVDGFKETQWTKKNLPTMKSKIYDIDTMQYKISFKKTEKTFTQKVWVEDSGFSTEFRFEVINNKWYLVYILDQNL